MLNHGTLAENQQHNICNNPHVGPPCCRAEMYAGRVACCPLVSHGKYADGTDGWTSDRYITLSARRGQHNKCTTLLLASVIGQYGF